MVQTTFVHRVAALIEAFFKSAGPTIVPAALDIAIKGVAILLIVALAAILMRRASAAARHLVWFLGTTSLLLLPLLAALLPQWHVLPYGTTGSPPPAGATNSSAPALATARVANSASVANAPSIADRATTENATASVPTSAAAAPIGVPHGSENANSQFGWQAWLLSLWAIGSAVLLARTLFGFFSLAWLRHQSTRIGDGHWEILFGGVAAQLGIRRPIELLSSSRRAMPMVWGLWRIHVLLPADSTEWTPEQWRVVLLHELAHARRFDCLTQLIAQLSCALWWFNPLVWLARRRMQVERERACDDLVLESGTKPSDYAEQLVRIAAQMPIARFGAAAIAMARPSTLESRVAAILDSGINRRRLAIVAVAAMALAVCSSAVALAMLTSIDRNRDIAPQKITKKQSDLTPPVGFARVVDAQGTPVAGANVESTNRKWSTITDRNGLFGVPDFNPGGTTSLSLKFHARGFLDQADVTVTRRNDGIVIPRFDVIQLDRPGRIEGRVIGPDGKPLAKVPISADVNAPHISIPNGAEALSDAEGRFVFKNVRQGMLVLWCPGEPAHHRWPSPVHGVGTMTTVHVADGQSVGCIVLDLSASKAIATGRVVDKDGKPFSGAKVLLSTKATLEWPDFHGHTDTNTCESILAPSERKSDAQGRFTLSGLPLGKWYLEAIADFGHATVIVVSDPVELTDKHTAVPDLVLPVVRTAKGRVRRLPPMSSRDSAMEWIDATLAGDAEGANALVAAGSPFAKNAARISSLLPQVTRFGCSSEGSDGTGSATTYALDLGNGRHGTITFELVRQSDEWRIPDVVDENRKSLLAN